MDIKGFFNHLGQDPLSCGPQQTKKLRATKSWIQCQVALPIYNRSFVEPSKNLRRIFVATLRPGMSKSSRPPRPMLQLAVPANQLEAAHGEDPEYDGQLHHYYWTYHNLVDLMVRLAVNENSMAKMLIDLSAMVGLDGVPLHFQLFPKLWLDIYSSRNIETSTLNSAITLLVDSHGFLEYVDAVLLDERSSLNNQYVFQFLYIFFPKVSDQVRVFRGNFPECKD